VYAGVAVRFVAVLVDCVVLAVGAWAIALFSGGTQAVAANGGASASFELVGNSVLVWLGSIFAYYVVMEATAGGTIGKLATGIRVVDEHGERITFAQALVRNMLRPIDLFFFYLVAALAVWTSAGRQRVGDRAACTFVVHPARFHRGL
jgi:uncharacterized RDD family membrane protein YckC